MAQPEALLNSFIEQEYPCSDPPSRGLVRHSIEKERVKWKRSILQTGR